MKSKIPSLKTFKEPVIKAAGVHLTFLLKAGGKGHHLPFNLERNTTLSCPRGWESDLKGIPA